MQETHNRLEAQGDIQFDRLEFFRERPLPAPQPAVAGTTHYNIYDPPQSFKIGINVYFVLEKSDRSPEELDSLIPRLPGRENAPVSVWTVACEAKEVTITDAAGRVQQYKVLQPIDKKELNDDIHPNEILSDEEAREVYHPLRATGFYPDTRYVSKKKHLRFPVGNEVFFLIGSDWLTTKMNLAQNADFEFAQSIQGLQGCTQDVVWTCANSAQTLSDRNMFVDKFLGGYMQKFLSNYPASQNNDPVNVIAEAVRMYEKLCQKWTVQHINGISPRVQAHCESLIVQFYDQFKHRLEKSKVTIKDLTFFLRRSNLTNKKFALCVHHYMSKMEQDRGTRNANYKSMNSVHTQSMYALKMMKDLLLENIDFMVKAKTNDVFPDFHLGFIDWLDIANQFRFSTPKFEGWRHHAMAQFQDGAGQNAANAMYPFL